MVRFNKSDTEYANTQSKATVSVAGLFLLSKHKGPDLSFVHTNLEELLPPSFFMFLADLLSTEINIGSDFS